MRRGIAAFAKAPLQQGSGRASARTPGGGGSAPEGLQAGRKLVGFVVDERVERVSEPGLSDELERGAAHPLVDVEVCRAFGTNTVFDGTNELWQGM